MPVHNVGHIVVAHFCQFEDILDDKPAHGGDDDADYDDDEDDIIHMDDIYG